MGYGLDGYKGGKFDETGRLIKETVYKTDDYLYGVINSYTDLVREGLGIDRSNVSALNYPAMRVQDALYYLGAGPEDDFFEYCYDERFQQADIDAFGEAFVYDPTGTKNDTSKSSFISGAAGDNKLIIDQAGNSDLFYSVIEQTLSEIASINKDNAASVVSGAIKRLWDAHANFKVYYPALIERLQELNPEATVVLVGMFNPFSDLLITDYSILPIFNTFAIVVNQINADIEAFAEQYGCKYADISNAETASANENITIQKVINGEVYYERVFHLSPEGHKFVARQILNTLKVTPEDKGNNIVVDIGRFTNVDYVNVDGMCVDYSINGSVLTVPYEKTDATLLTVAIKNGDGTISLVSYALSYDNGYTAQKLYGTNDVFGTAFKPVKLVFSGLLKIVDLFKGLFK